MEAKHLVVFILGGPGSGKGTQSALIQEKFGFKHLSAGDLLRQERKSGSQCAELIENCIKQGKIVPSQITVGLLGKAMDKASPINKFLIDGFPRNDQNRSNWDNLMNDKAFTPFIIQFDCPQDILVQRILKRAESSGRSDDNKQSIKKRLHTYSNQTLPVVEHYVKLNKCKRVDGSQTVEKIFSQLEPIFQKMSIN